MSKRKPSTHADALQRARTLIVLQASRAALKAYRKVVNQQVAAALAMLDDLESYAKGTGKLPRRAVNIGEAFHRVDVAAASGNGDAEDHANGELFRHFDGVALMDLCDAAVIETYRQATTPNANLGEALAEISKKVHAPFSGGTPQVCHDAFARAAFGRSEVLHA